MSKDEKEQEFRVSDKRRFKMDEDGEITDTKQPDAKEETKTEEKEAKSEEQTEQQQQEDKEFCEEKFKDVPPVNFTTLIFSLSTQAMVSLGELQSRRLTCWVSWMKKQKETSRRRRNNS